MRYPQEPNTGCFHTTRPECNHPPGAGAAAQVWRLIEGRERQEQVQEISDMFTEPNFCKRVLLTCPNPVQKQRTRPVVGDLCVVVEREGCRKRARDRKTWSKQASKRERDGSVTRRDFDERCVTRCFLPGGVIPAEPFLNWARTFVSFYLAHVVSPCHTPRRTDNTSGQRKRRAAAAGVASRKGVCSAVFS